MKLTRQSWIEAGMQMLARQGVGDVRVTALARRLGVTRGSFYWHFKDRDDLLESMLVAWEAETTENLASASDAPPGIERIRALLREGQKAPGRLPDVAIFAWASSDSAIAQRVSVVERQRLEFVTRALRDGGYPRGRAEKVSLIAYLASRGWEEHERRDPDLVPERSVFGNWLMELIETPSK